MIDITKKTNDKDLIHIEAIARDSALPVEQVEALYLLERADLELVARIKTYIPVLTTRRVRQKLRQLSGQDDLDAELAMH
jgi:hypothetical protein